MRISKSFFKAVLTAFICALPIPAFARLKVVATTSTMRSIVEAVGGDRVEVASVAKGPQDPHFLEAKPSYMIMLRDADLLVAVGLDLEVGWLPNVSRGSRNPKILPGEKGYLELGPLASPIEVPAGKIDRAEGDVHPFGNPHFYLDPERVAQVVGPLAARLGELDPDGKAVYEQRAKEFAVRLKSLSVEWGERLVKTGIKKVITYHRTLNYFLDRFRIAQSGTLEPKPGVPPTAKHLMELIAMVKSEKINCILVESFFETGAAERIKQEVPSVKVQTVAAEVEALPPVKAYVDLGEQIVRAVESCHGSH